MVHSPPMVIRIDLSQFSARIHNSRDVFYSRGAWHVSGRSDATRGASTRRTSLDFFFLTDGQRPADAHGTRAGSLSRRMHRARTHLFLAKRLFHARKWVQVQCMGVGVSTVCSYSNQQPFNFVVQHCAKAKGLYFMSMLSLYIRKKRCGRKKT